MHRHRLELPQAAPSRLVRDPLPRHDCVGPPARRAGGQAHPGRLPDATRGGRPLSGLSLRRYPGISVTSSAASVTLSDGPRLFQKSWALRSTRVASGVSVPETEGNLEDLKAKLYISGAGTIGNYDECSFSVKGIGTFKGNSKSNPVIGKKGIQTKIEEVKVTFTFPAHKEQEILQTLKINHPYDEYSYEIISTENINRDIGLGMVGKLSKSMNENEFISYTKDKMNTKFIRHSELTGRNIKTVAVLGGSGSFAINNAISTNADVYVTSDLKYHDFFKANKKILLTDIGHYESEQYTKNAIHTYLTEKITNFAIVLAETNSNPVKYS